jgi:hypothetical protein
MSQQKSIYLVLILHQINFLLTNFCLYFRTDGLLSLKENYENKGFGRG